MTKSMTVVAFITLAAITAAPAMAFRDMRTGYGSGPGTVAEITGAPGLHLSVEQLEKIGALREIHLKDIQPLQTQLHGKGKRLRELWLEKTPDRERILTLQREVQELRSRLLDKLATYRLEVHQILTPEQQTKVQNLEVERRMGRMDAFGMERRRPRGWWEEESPPGSGLRRDKRPDPQPNVGGEGAQGVGGAGRSVGY